MDAPVLGDERRVPEISPADRARSGRSQERDLRAQPGQGPPPSGRRSPKRSTRSPAPLRSIPCGLHKPSTRSQARRSATARRCGAPLDAEHLKRCQRRPSRHTLGILRTWQAPSVSGLVPQHLQPGRQIGAFRARSRPAETGREVSFCPRAGSLGVVASARRSGTPGRTWRPPRRRCGPAAEAVCHQADHDVVGVWVGVLSRHFSRLGFAPAAIWHRRPPPNLAASSSKGVRPGTPCVISESYAPRSLHLIGQLRPSVARRSS